MTPAERYDPQHDGGAGRCGRWIDRVDADPLADLAKPVAAPDFTRPIMGRLGYMQVRAKVARRRRFMRWSSRCCVVLAAAAALGVAVTVFEDGPHARRPAGLTIPDALGSDLQQQQHRIGNVIHTIRSLAPKPRNDRVNPDRPAEFPARPTDDVNQSMAPVQWV